jgi:hypothetical protein
MPDTHQRVSDSRLASEAFRNRGLAKQHKGDSAGGDADIAKAMQLKSERGQLMSAQRMAASGVRRGKAALSCGCKSHPATAPAGSNRSSHGGNEVAEACG